MGIDTPTFCHEQPLSFVSPDMSKIPLKLLRSNRSVTGGVNGASQIVLLHPKIGHEIRNTNQRVKNVLQSQPYILQAGDKIHFRKLASAL